MKTHDLWRCYWQHLNYLSPQGPLIEKTWTAMIEEPFRIGTCVVLRIPRTRHGIAVGWWGPPRPEEVTLALATGYRVMSDEEIDDAEFLA